jgi:hypothetical protein
MAAIMGNAFILPGRDWPGWAATAELPGGQQPPRGRGAGRRTTRRRRQQRLHQHPQLVRHQVINKDSHGAGYLPYPHQGANVRLPGGSVMIRAVVGGGGCDPWNDMARRSTWLNCLPGAGSDDSHHSRLGNHADDDRLAERSPQIINYGNSAVDVGDVPVTPGTTYYIVWDQPAVAAGSGDLLVGRRSQDHPKRSVTGSGEGL